MPLRHSRPAHPRSTLSRTRSSHGSPAAAVSSTAPSASRVVTPRSAILTTSPSTPSSATTRFEPPPRTRKTRRRAAAHSSASSTVRSSRASTKNRAGPPTPSVVSGASGTFSATVIDRDPSVEDDDAAGHLAAPQRLEALVDLVERPGPADELVELEAAVEVQVDQA